MRYFKDILFISCLVSFGFASFSQQTFEKIYDLGLNPCREAIQLDDGSYMHVNIHYITYFSNTGEILWQKDIQSNFYPNTICYGGDCFYLGGTDQGKIFYGKYDLDANEIWKAIISTKSNKYIYHHKLLLTSDNRILFAARYSNNEDSILVIKADTSGHEIWRADIGMSASYGQILDFDIINDHKYGILHSNTLVLLDSSGLIMDEMDLSFIEPKVIQYETVNDSTCLLLNYESLFKYSLSGILDTLLSFDSLAGGLLYYDSSDIYVCTGGSYGYGSNFIRLIKVDTNANIIWNKRYGDENEYVCNWIKTIDNGFFMIGGSRTQDFNYPLGYLIKTDSDGNVSPCKDSLFATKERYLLCLDTYAEIESWSIGSHSTAYWTFEGDTVHSGNEPFTFYGNEVGDFTHILRSCDDSLVVPIRVYDTVFADFTYEITDSGVQYYQQPLDEGWKWEWKMGDGTRFPDSLNPFYQYAINGNYFTLLDVWSPCRSDCTKRVIYNLNIKELPELRVKIFPNPANDYLMVHFPEQGNYYVELIDLNGQLIKSEHVNGRTECSFDISGLPASVYLLRTSTENTSEYYKFIKVCR